MPEAFRPSALVSTIQVCHFCGEQRKVASTLTERAQETTQPVLWTLGYAGTRLEQVVSALLERKVQVVLDTRRYAWSTQAGFDGATLRRAIEGQHLVYRHRPELGTPSNLRRALHEEGDWAAFATAYQVQLAREAPLLDTIADFARSHVVCLVCREHHAELCHRSLLAQRLAELGGLHIEHLELW